MWEVIERSRVVPLLKSSLQRGKLPNAYLLAGPVHVGKMTLAVNLAQALNCEAEDKPCGKCAACRKIKAGKHADVQIVSLASASKDSKTKEIGIDPVREIQHSASLPPYEGKYKVFIIDGAELLSNEAANCLLKTLEEPAENVIYILLTANDKQVLPTVISRCQRLELLPLPACDIEQHMAADKTLEADKVKLISRLARGCPGWAVTAAADEGILADRAEAVERITDVINGNIGVRFAYAEQLAKQFSQNRQMVFDELEGLWLDWWHDLLLVKTGNTETIINIDLTAGLGKAAAEYKLTQIRLFISQIQTAAAQLRLNANPRLVLEVMMLNIPGRNK